MLHRAFRNLIENALRHAPSGTTVEVDVQETGSIRISDQGPGIAPEERELIFRRFWRRERSRSGAAGLGLSIVRTIMDAHQADISVENGPSGGAIFTMRFPRGSAEARGTASAA
jgi:signal transduction histidine kinase